MALSTAVPAPGSHGQPHSGSPGPQTSWPAGLSRPGGQGHLAHQSRNVVRAGRMPGILSPGLCTSSDPRARPKEAPRLLILYQSCLHHPFPPAPPRVCTKPSTPGPAGIRDGFLEMTRLEAEGIDLRVTAGHQDWTARLESETSELSNCPQLLEAIFSATCAGSDLIRGFFQRAGGRRGETCGDQRTRGAGRTGM